MKIDQSIIAFQSQHASASLHTQESTLRAWVGKQRPDFEGQRTRAAQQGVTVSVSSQALALARAQAQVQASAKPAADVKQADAVSQADEPVTNDPHLRMLMAMVEAITGRAVRVFDASELQANTSQVAAATPSATPTAAAPAAPAQQPAGWGLEVDTHEVVSESESTQVSAQGVVRTADGQQINFTLQLSMSRSFYQESSSSIRAGDAVRKDPLVINFSGTGAQLTDSTFAFDLNADGKAENIAFATGGSGFLALDKNGDGQINNGQELFGPSSGNGFTDLAQYDQDGNQWIDENDAVYSQLRVWQRDASGQDRLTTLAQNGVGALHLGQVASPFSVNTATNQTLGLVRSTGLFLYESGQAGSLQQVDL